jgi:AcrR family transcriptional regulator
MRTALSAPPAFYHNDAPMAPAANDGCVTDIVLRLYTQSVEVLMPRDQMRKDAKRNREAILDAARELFAESADVAMCEVARRAGLGQATLYRNFPDRRALAAEVLGEHVERIARLAAEHAGDPDAFFVLLKSLVESTVQLYAMSELAREDACVGSQLERDRERVGELMKRPLRDAKAAGILRRDMSVDDVFLVLLMVRGAMERTHGVVARASAAVRALSLALDGLVPPSPRT